ncbi:MAG: type II secretion system F family protein [Bryobacterales bacterium]|nr:type II secretion system F family protein [Bryobacterales bacterium]
MTAGLLFGLFLLITVAVTAAGYVFVLRPSRVDSANLQLPDAITTDQRDLHAAQAAVVDVFRLIGEAMPNSSNQVELRRQLMIAGYRWPSAVSIFMGIKVAMALVLGIALAWGAMVGRSDFGAAGMAALCGLGLGYLIPDRVLNKIASRRMTELRRGLPAALDLMVLGIEAGQGLDAAILDTSRGLRVSQPELASEFTQLHLEMRTSTSRAEALRNFGLRCKDGELKKFANLLVDTDRFGTSLGPALKTHARYLRIRIRQTTQEKARKIGVKLIFPVFFLIFPSVLLVTLGPAVIMLMGQLKHLMDI